MIQYLKILRMTLSVFDSFILSYKYFTIVDNSLKQVFARYLFQTGVNVEIHNKQQL